MVLAALAAAIVSGHDVEFSRLPARMAGLYLVADLRTRDGKTHPFLIDTGATRSYASAAIMSTEDQKRKTATLRFNLGNAEVLVEAVPIEPQNLPHSAELTKVEGIIGLDVLGRLQLDIDYASGTIQARRGGSWVRPQQDMDRVGLNADAHGLYTVQADIGGKQIPLCLDTGATALLLDTKRVDVTSLPKLPPSKIRTFEGLIETERRLIETMTIGTRPVHWMIASTQSWSGVGDGVIGTAMLGSKRIILDFPGRALYLAKRSQEQEMDASAERVLGLPVQIRSGGLWFRDDVPLFLKRWSRARIVALRRMKAEDVVAALRKEPANATEMIIAAFKAMRSPGLVTIALANGEKEISPLRIED
jgi:predicted aspartyl protease